MANPVLIAVLALAGGAVAGNAFAKAEQKRKEDAQAREKALGQAVTELEQGKPYMVTLEVDPRHPQWGGVRDPATASTLIKSTMQQLGWQFGTANPMPRGPSDTANLQAGRPSTWVFPAVWRGAGKTMPPAPMSPGWISMALVTPIPSF